jgi:Cu+-exporting ATPase
MAIDPVCGMNVDEDSAQWRSEHKGETYYFCSPGCHKAFEAEPEKFLDDDADGSHQQHHKM